MPWPTLGKQLRSGADASTLTLHSHMLPVLLLALGRPPHRSCPCA